MSIQYEEAYPHIRNGDIVFFNDKSSKWVRLFQWFTGSEYFHVGIAFWLNFNGKDKLFLVEAIPPGRRLINLATYSNAPLVIMRRETNRFPDMDSKYVTDYYFEALVEGAGNTHYSLIGFLSMLVYEKLGIKLFSYQGETCSEMVAKVLQLDKTYISPGTLFEALQKMKYKPVLKINQV